MNRKPLHYLRSVCLKALPILLFPTLALFPAQSRADTIYSTLGAFNAATGSKTTITFNGIAAPGSFVGETSPVTFSGATFSSGSVLFVIDPGYYGYLYSHGGFLSADYTNPDVVTVALPLGTTAVGFDYGGLLGAPGSFLVSLSDGFTATLTTTHSIAGGSLSFAGFTSPTALTSIKLTLPDAPGYNAIDNFVYSTASQTPEPTTLGLVLTGLLGVSGAVRRRFQ